MFNIGFFCIGIIIVSWILLSFFLEQILLRNVLNNSYKQILLNDATHFDNKGELLESYRENSNEDDQNKNPQELNEEIELKAVSPPRKIT